MIRINYNSMESTSEQTQSSQQTTETTEATEAVSQPAVFAWSSIDEKGECNEVPKEVEDSDNVAKSDNVEESEELKEVKDVDESDESDESDNSDMCCEEDCECVVHLECPHCNVTLGLKKELTTFRCLACGMQIDLDSESELEEEEEEEEEVEEEEDVEEKKSTIPSFITTSVKFLMYAYVVKFLLYMVDGGNTFQHTCHCVCEGGKFMSLP